MVGPQTTLALTRRARLAVYWLDDWAVRLQAEMKRQGAEPSAQQIPSDLANDSNQTITLTRGELRELILGMRTHSGELRRYAK